MKDREDFSTLYTVEDDKNIAICFLYGQKVRRKTKRSRAEYNAQRCQGDQRCPKKPHFVAFYDITKGGVDVMDMIAEFFIMKFKTRCRALNTSAYILDRAKTNALTIYRNIHPENKKKVLILYGICVSRQRGRMGKGVVFTTTLVAGS